MSRPVRMWSAIDGIYISNWPIDEEEHHRVCPRFIFKNTHGRGFLQVSTNGDMTIQLKVAALSKPTNYNSFIQWHPFATCEKFAPSSQNNVYQVSCALLLLFAHLHWTVGWVFTAGNYYSLVIEISHDNKELANLNNQLQLLLFYSFK